MALIGRKRNEQRRLKKSCKHNKREILENLIENAEELTDEEKNTTRRSNQNKRI